MRSPFLVVIALAACSPPAQTSTKADRERAGEPSGARAGDSMANVANVAHDMQPARGTVVISTPTGAQRYAVELAIKPAERSKGLMFREHLDDDSGMLFLFEDLRIQSFWMKNTRIPLDMIFIDEDLLIVGIVESAEPLTLSARKVDKKSRYVLELAGGMARKRGIAAGQTVAFEGVPTHLTQKATQ